MKNRPFRRLDTSARPRKRGTSRLFVLGAAFAASAAVSVVSGTAYAQALSASAAAQSGAPTLPFNIAAGPLSDVIQAYEQASGVRVRLALDSISGIQSPGVSGSLTPEQALRALLVGTSVTFNFTSATAATLELRIEGQSVEVSGRLPSVASPKYVAPLREIPQTIAVVPRAVFEAQGATTLSDALRNVPGITLQAGEGGGSSSTAGDMFNLRGFNASNSLFVDNVRDDGLIARDVFNLEQVEVFLGPTGSDVGRTTAAGYVNMQTKTPHLGSDSSALLTFGSANQARLAGDFNWALPAAGDSWLSKSAVRLNVLWQDSGVPGRDEVKNERKAIAPSIAFGLDTRTRLTVGAQVVRQNNLPDYGIPGAAWADAALTPTTVRAASAVDQTNYYGNVNFDRDDAEQDSITARLEHDVNRDLTVRHQTRYNKAHRQAVISAVTNVAAFDAATSQVTIARQGNERENTIISNQTSLTNRFTTGAVRHAVSTGVEVTSEKQFAPTLTGLGTQLPVDIYRPDVESPVTGFAPTRSAAFSDGQTSTVAVYAFDTVDLTSRWQFTGGARWEHFDTDYKTVDAAGLTTADLNASDGLFSGKAGLLYRVNATANVYASVGTAVTPPGTANFTLSAQANNANNPSVEPQKSTNYELGSKWDLAAGRLSFNAALFRTDNRNVIYTVDATAIPPIYNQDDAQRVKGATVGFLGRVTDRWEVLANIGYIDSELRTQNSANNGRRLTLTPEFSSSLWTTYRFPVGLSIGGGVRQTSKVFVNAANTIQSPGYTLVDLLTEYAVNSHLSLRLNVNNLTDETYIRNVNNNGGRYNPGYTRAATLTTNVRF